MNSRLRHFGDFFLPKKSRLRFHSWRHFCHFYDKCKVKRLTKWKMTNQKQYNLEQKKLEIVVKNRIFSPKSSQIFPQNQKKICSKHKLLPNYFDLKFFLVKNWNFNKNTNVWPIILTEKKFFWQKSKYQLAKKIFWLKI